MDASEAQQEEAYTAEELAAGIENLVRGIVPEEGDLDLRSWSETSELCGGRVFSNFAETRAHALANRHERPVFTRNPHGTGYVIKKKRCHTC